jgi:eukaryotic-like serine/threonine-protein kinase
MGPLLGRYELLMRVGTGGMATVWAARLRGTRGFQKLVALKTILPRYSSDPEYERLLLDEARLTAQVHHPNVAQILDLGEDNGLLFLAMEWIEGVSLSELLRAAEESGVQIPLSVAIRIGTQVAAGLHAAHELRDADGELVGLVHRDVSPQNVLVSFDGITKVIDFGIAKAMRDTTDDATRSFQVRGKVGYLAPEQIMDATMDRRVDVFALGVVLYVLTVGAHPFEGRGPLATLYNITQEPVTLPSTFRKDYPAELEAAILKCLEKDRARRFASCDELVWALESSIPSDLRATDQDVAVFVRSIAGGLVAQRSRALELAAAESGNHPGLSPSPAVGDGVGQEDSAPVTFGRGGSPIRAREGGSLHLIMWGAVFAASVWILVTQWRTEPLAEPAPPTPAVVRSPRACPPEFSAVPPVSTTVRSQRVSNRSEKP